MAKTFTVLAEKYNLVSEAPLEVEVISSGEHKSTHNVKMARTKALQAAEVAAELFEILEQMKEDEPLHAWKVTHITQSADMMQDVLASIKADLMAGRELEQIKDGEE
jgi:hypothetical protein